MFYTIKFSSLKESDFMIVYLHGFNSTGDSAKGKALKSSLQGDIDFYTPTYHYEPDLAIASLTKYIKHIVSQQSKNEPRMIIGSSLGGFYAQYLARQFSGFKVVLINPALGPITTLQNHLGENKNFYTGEKYILQQKHLDQLQRYNVEQPCLNHTKTLLLIDKDDEVIEYSFAVEQYKKCAEIILYDGGDHQFQHLDESIPKIKHFYKT